MRAIRLPASAFLLAVLATAAVSQTAGTGAAPASGTVAATPNEKAQWLERANLITAAIQEDAPHLAPDLQYILPGRLGELWRKVDAKRAQAWLDQALAKISTPPETESGEQRKARLDAASAWLPGLNNSDPTAADQMIDSLIAEAKRNSAAGGQYSNDVMELSESLQRAIFEGAMQDPQRAFRLAERLLELRAGDSIGSTYLNLRAADPELADRFALDALRWARDNNYDRDSFFALAQLASPLANLPEKMRAPETVTAPILESLAAGMLRPAQNAADKEHICELAMPVTVAMKRFPAEQQPLLKAAVDNCKSTSPRVTRSVAGMEARTNATAPGELLNQASDISDVRSRASLKDAAARQADRQKDYAKAFEIADGFTEEERQAWEMWPILWRQEVQQALTALYRAGDLQGLQLLLARVPDNERPRLLLQAANLGFSSKDAGYGISMLTQARRELEKNLVTDDYHLYVNLLMLYARQVPEEATSVLRLAVSGINSFKVPEKAKIRPFEPGWRLEPIQLPPELLDSDPQMVTAAISELKSPQARVAMRLGLLQACLQRYQGPAKPPARKADSKPPAPPAPKDAGKPASKAAAEEKKN